MSGEENKLTCSKIFCQNVHPVERGVRIAVGAGLLGLAIAGTQSKDAKKSKYSSIGFVGIIPLLTGLLGTCPLYTLAGFSTNCSKSECEKKCPKGGCSSAEKKEEKE